MKQLVNASKDRRAAGNLEVADSFVTRFIGLLGRRNLPEGSGLLITKCSSIHMFFMRFAIDAVFVDGNMAVVEVVPELRPWRVASCPKARHTIELPAGAAAKAGIEAGDELCIVEKTAIAERAPAAGDQGP